MFGPSSGEEVLVVAATHKAFPGVKLQFFSEGLKTVGYDE